VDEKQRWILRLLYRGKIPRLSERVFVNVYGAQESIPPGWDSIPGLLKRFTNTGSASISLLSIRSKRKQDATCHKEREERWFANFFNGFFLFNI
jgi:hypothetical protein